MGKVIRYLNTPISIPTDWPEMQVKVDGVVERLHLNEHVWKALLGHCGYEPDERPAVGTGPMRFINRADALAKLRVFQELKMRNYELEGDLELGYGGRWCIAEWCPFNGRFCKLQDYAPFPHPLMWNEREPVLNCSKDWALPSISELMRIAAKKDKAASTAKGADNENSAS